MKVTDDVHQQFADYFAVDDLKPYLYLLSRKLSEGHLCLDINTIDTNEFTGTGYTKMVTEKKLAEQALVSDGSSISPFVLYNSRLYLHRYYNYETMIYNRIIEFIEDEKTERKSRLAQIEIQQEFISGLLNNTGANPNQNTNWPAAAIISAVLNNFTIITGGPGTGKTTTVAKILSIFFTITPKVKVALAAQTGKAASRMKESLKNATGGFSKTLQEKFDTLEPSTIHRMLGNKRNSLYFKHNRENPLDYEVVIIDESSMIDVAMFAKLLDAIDSNTRLILLGDKDQLASVEAGSMFGDLCQAQDQLNKFSKATADFINSFIKAPAQQISTEYIEIGPTHPLFEHIIELRGSHRFSDNEGIGKFSQSILFDKEGDIAQFFDNTYEQVRIDPEYSDKIFTEFIAGYEAFIHEDDILKALKKLNRLRVLCAVREGEHGVYAINRKIESYLRQKGHIRITGNFYMNKPIIVTSNNYELELFNGDIGIIRPDENGVLKAWFEARGGSVRHVLPGYISGCETVYAMTIHKSQGSEFEKVLVILPRGNEIKIMTRELLYTAVTRAKERVIVQGSHEMILAAAKQKVQRGSGIIDRFNQQ